MTVDAVVRQRIDEVVQQFVDEGRMFTAFEVSLSVKESGVRERHRNMRDVVHESIARQAGDHYTRTLRDVGAPVQAWVYHRLRDNPYEYQPLERDDGTAPAPGGMAPAPGGTAPDVASSRQTGPPAAAPRDPKPLSAAASSTPATEVNGAFGSDASGWLVLTARAVQTLGLSAGDEVVASFDKDNREIRLARPSQFTRGDVTLKVDDDDRLRITREQLEQADLDGLQCYHVTGRGNLITIRDFT